MPAPQPAAPAGSAPGAAPGSQTTVATSFILIAAEGASPPIKLSTQDAQRIQENTGLPPEQLEDNDLRESMQELNIQSAPLTQQDKAALGMPTTPQTQASGSTTVARQQPINPQVSTEQQLESLQNMKNQGLISEDDYNAKKKQVLGI
jgi:hypothetical protein